MQRLTGIDVAEPGHHALVEKRRFERRAAARKGRPQIFGIEVVAEGLGTKRAEERMARRRRGVDDVHQAEAAGIGVDDAGAVIEQEGHVIVARRFGGRTRRGELVITLAQRHWPAGWRVDGEAAAHAEMHEEAVAAVEPDQEVLCPPSDRVDAAAGKPAGEAPGKGNAQILPVQPDLLDPTAKHGGFEAPPHGFNLGQLRHGAVMAGLGRAIQCFLDRLEC